MYASSSFEDDRESDSIDDDEGGRGMPQCDNILDLHSLIDTAIVSSVLGPVSTQLVLAAGTLSVGGDYAREMMMAEDNYEPIPPDPSLIPSSSTGIVANFADVQGHVPWRYRMRNIRSENSLQLRSGGIDKRSTAHAQHHHTRGRVTCPVHVWSVARGASGVARRTVQCSCTRPCMSIRSHLDQVLGESFQRIMRPQRFTYSYRLEITESPLPALKEEPEDDLVAERGSPADGDALDSPPGSASWTPEEPSDIPDVVVHRTPVISEDEMCNRLAALPIGVGALESALATSLSLHSSPTLQWSRPRP